MKYVSTRGKISLNDTEAVLRGIAPDGGLYVPENIQDIKIDWRACLKMPPYEMASAIIGAFLPGFDDMPALVRSAYNGKFETEDITPVVPLGDDWLIELFRGPTSAFKDVALSILPHLMTAARRKEGAAGDTVILTATSGDTGKAALEGFRDVSGTRIIVFYPDGGVSPIQRAQMATQEGKNVTVCAVRGNFDDCQSAVKQAFSLINSEKLLDGTGLSLSSANSINIGRLVPQIVYYFAAYKKLAEAGRIRVGECVDFVVPTGNFGDILAGYYAKLMELPVGRLVCASNVNRVLTDFLSTGMYDIRRPFVRSSSPSMDILISSNLERLLYLASGCDGEFVSDCMSRLKTDNVYTVPKPIMDVIRGTFECGCCTEEETLAEIGKVWSAHRYLIDPHTAVAAKVAEDYKNRRVGNAPVVILSTASPYKFPAPVLTALGEKPEGDEYAQIKRINELTGIPVPKNLAGLEGRAELHADVIDRENILPYILKKLEVEK